MAKSKRPSKSSVPRRINPRDRLDPRDPLRIQLRGIREYKEIEQKELAYLTGSSEPTIRRLLAKEPDPERPYIDPVLAVSVGDILGLSADYISIAFMRDTLCTAVEVSTRHPTEEQKAGDRPLSDINKMRLRIAASLTETLRWMNPLPGKERMRRLAIRTARLMDDLSIADVAAKLARRRRVPLSQAQRLIYLYETGRVSLNENELSDLALTLKDGGLSEIDRRGHELLNVHSVGDSLEITQQWPPRNTKGAGPWLGKQPDLRWYCPATSNITLERSPKVLTARQRRFRKRSTVRCVGARHDGYELAVVVTGAILLTISTTPFRPERNNDMPKFEKGRDGIIEHRHCAAGEVICYNSGLYHRCEFIGIETRVVSFNVGRNVNLSRRITRGCP
jgi:hypothetical protein